MSILMHGIPMPKSCSECKLDLRTDICKAFCKWNAEHPYSIRATDRLPDYPLSEVPEPCEDAVSRKAVANMLDNIEIPGNASWYLYYHQALDRLAKLPSAQPEETCESCLYRELDWHEEPCDSCTVGGESYKRRTEQK